MITEIRYNWRQEGNYDDGIREDYNYAKVGRKESNTGLVVKSITAIWETTDVLTYKIAFDDNSSVTIFNPNMVFRSPE